MHTERNKKSVIGQSYLFFCLIASLAGAGGFLALYLKQGDLLNVDGIYTSVLFQEGVPLTLFTVLFSAAVLIFLSALLFLKPCSSPRRSDPNTYGRVFAQSACGIGLLSLLVMQFLMSKQKISVTPYDLSASTGKLQWVALGCALISALYFLVPLFTDRFKGSARILVGIFIPVWCCLQLLLNHFFSLDPLSSPTKISNVCSLCALALFFLSELRMELPERAVSKAYAAMGMIAFFCTFTECVPKLILTFGGKCGFSLGLTSFYTIVKLFLGIYALISAYPALVSDKESKRSFPKTPRVLPSRKRCQNLPKPPKKTPEIPTALHLRTPTAAQTKTIRRKRKKALLPRSLFRPTCRKTSPKKTP